jgi:hypothetical protein
VIYGSTTPRRDDAADRILPVANGINLSARSVHSCPLAGQCAENSEYRNMHTAEIHGPCNLT